MATYLLILAHLAGDFLFQPGKLAMWKQKSLLGVLVHVLIVVALVGILFIPYLNQTQIWIAMGVLGLTHFGQDALKVWYEKKFNTKGSAYPFFVDQFMHIAIIIILGLYLSANLTVPEVSLGFLGNLYFNQNIYIYLSLLILFSYALDIAIFQSKKHKDPKAKYTRQYDAMSKRVVAFSVGYLLFIVLGLFLERL